MHSDTWDVGFHQKMRAKCYCVFSDSEHIHRTSGAKDLANSIVAVTQQCPCLWEGLRWATNPVTHLDHSCPQSGRYSVHEGQDKEV